MANYRIPRAYARRHPQYQELMEGQRPTVKGLVASTFLPITEIEPVHEDPIVIPAGTWVGILGADATGSATNTGALGSITAYSLAPACSTGYSVNYTTNDTTVGATFGVGNKVTNIDTNAAIVDGAEGESTHKLGDDKGVRPLGIAFHDIYAGWMGTQYTNYDRQPNIGFLMSNQIVQVPCITAQEKAIEPGDLVMVDGYDNAEADGVLAWNGTGVGDRRVGRLVGWKDAVASLPATATGGTAALELGKLQEHIVGRCLRKVLVADFGPSASTHDLLSAHVSTGKTSDVNLEYRVGGRVQTVPGLGLQGSGTLGVPGWLLSSRADTTGVFWALEIAVGTY